MNRKALGLTPLLIAALLIPLPAQAAAKAGSVCSKIGKIENFGGKKFTCVKSGKKLVWNKGVAAKSPTSPSSKPEVSAPVAAKWAVPKNLPTSFENLYENRAGISYAAWQKTSDAISQNQANLPRIEISIGPNTSPWSKNHEEVIAQVSKSFTKQNAPKNLYIIFQNYKDISWAEQRVKEVFPADEFAEWIRNEGVVGGNCQADIKDCLGAKQKTSRDGSISILLMGVSNQVGMLVIDGAKYGGLAVEETNKTGMVLAHEYIHSLQAAPFSSQQTFDFAYRPPTWMWEGSATFFQNAAINAKSYERFMDYRKASLGEYIEREGISESFVKSFLDKKIWTMNSYYGGVSPDWSYQLGERIIEILVAIKGPDSAQEIFNLMSQKQDFDLAFKTAFGITYEDAVPLIAKTLAANWKAGL